MKLRGSLLVIVCYMVVEFCDINQKEYLYLASRDSSYAISFLTLFGLLFLFYPLVGHLTAGCLPVLIKSKLNGISLK